MGRAKDPLIEPNWWELPAILALTALLAAAEIGDWRAEDTLEYRGARVVVAGAWRERAENGHGRQQSDLDAAVLVPRGDVDLFRPRQHRADDHELGQPISMRKARISFCRRMLSGSI